jgi:endonuclease/exonuclease/phosphatase family metal-dependent hydrolase
MIRLQDFDALLIRGDHQFTGVVEQQFAVRAPVDFGPLGAFDLIRGFVAADVTLRGTTVRVVTTHLEPVETAAVLQAAQAAELIEWLGGTTLPIVIAGDLNSAPVDDSPSSPYSQFMSAGFLDAWVERSGPKADQGFTCCHQTDLLNPVSAMEKRIDFVLFRNPSPGRGAVSAELFGVVPKDRLESGLWPSDHAGILATVMYPGPKR